MTSPHLWPQTKQNLYCGRQRLILIYKSNNLLNEVLIWFDNSGHPLCEFCEERFMDADELYRHLRKEHLYCHLCDADGRNLYYASHSALAHHFRTEHYLCEEGECAGQHLTAVFRSEIDLKGR